MCCLMQFTKDARQNVVLQCRTTMSHHNENGNRFEAAAYRHMAIPVCDFYRTLIDTKKILQLIVPLR